MRIAVDQDALAHMVVRHVENHHRTMEVAARRLADTMPSASDDAAGVAIATRMQARTASAAAASHNVQDGISLMQVAEGALSTMTEYLQRVRVIALQAGNDTFGADQRKGLQVGVDALLRGFDDTWRSIDDGVRTIQVGIDAGDTMTVPTGPHGERAWGVSVLDAGSARSALDVLDEALEELYAHRATVGAAHNRLERILGTLGVQQDVGQATAARTTEADLGEEVVRLLTSRTWAQAGAQMLAEVQVAGRRAIEVLLASAEDLTEDVDEGVPGAPGVAGHATHALMSRVTPPVMPLTGSVASVLFTTGVGTNAGLGVPTSPSTSPSPITSTPTGGMAGSTPLMPEHDPVVGLPSAVAPAADRTSTMDIHAS